VALAVFILAEAVAFQQGRLPRPVFVFSLAHNVALAFFIGLVVAQPKLILSRLLSWPPITLLGAVSYGVYIWQQYFTQPSGSAPQPSWFSFPWNLFCAILAGILSYWVIGRPVLKWRKYFVRVRVPAQTILR